MSELNEQIGNAEHFKGEEGHIEVKQYDNMITMHCVVWQMQQAKDGVKGNESVESGIQLWGLYTLY